MRPLAFMIGLVGAAALLPNVCNAQILNNPFSEYAERSITITPDGGNASDSNAAIHTIDPWPPYAYYTRIPDTGRHAYESVERMYSRPEPFSPAVGSTTTGGTGTNGQGTTGSGVGMGTSTGGGY
jgi:hypothetical protein